MPLKRKGSKILKAKGKKDGTRKPRPTILGMH